MAEARERLAVALDVPSLEDARRTLEALDGAAGWLKVGLELFVAAGPAAVALAARHGRVFLDLKLHDIPTTVARAVRAAGGLGVDLLTVHLAGGSDMLRAAREAARACAGGEGGPGVVGGSVLTSLSDADLQGLGTAGGVPAQVDRLTGLALACGLDGVVVSAAEAPAIRSRAGPALRIVTPGIRPAGAARDDQARVASPGAALAAGADLLVVGRPITGAPDPGAAARAVVAELAAALRARRD